MWEIFQLSWILITTICFGLASYYDLKDRLIPDKIWLIQITGGLVVDIIYFTNNFSVFEIYLFFANLIFCVIIGVVAFILGALGGGDVKALIALAFSSPFTHQISNYSLYIQNIFPMVLYFLSNFLLFMIFFALYNLVRNIIIIIRNPNSFSQTNGSIGQIISILLSGERYSLERIKTDQHFEPVEQFNEGKWELNTPIFMEQLDDDEFDEYILQQKQQAIRDMEKTDREYLWVRPHPPGLVFFLLSYLLLILVGAPLGFIFFIF